MRRRRGGIFLTAVLALAGLPAIAQAAPFDPATAVTLITGDKVIPGENGGAGVLLPVPGRERQTFTTFQSDGHTYVIPAT